MTEMDAVRRMHESNRAAWNEGAAGYDDLIGDAPTLAAGGTTLKPIELLQLGDLHGWCRRAIHLQCASGADTLSLVNLGASEVVGVDISDVHIDNARRKTEAFGFPALWYRTDLLDTPHELDGTADLVYTGKGALNWLQDLAGWSAVIYRLLRPGGRLFLFESHPIVWLFKEDSPTYDRDRQWSYFRTEPEMSQGWSEAYIGNKGRDPASFAQKFERLWPVSVIINHLIDAGLRLDRFTENPDWPFSFSLLPNVPADEVSELPQSYSILASKPQSP